MTADRLSRLASAVADARVIRGGDAAVTGVTHDSRRVEEGDLFVAVPGREHDGLSFVVEALSRGAAAVAAEAGPVPAAAGVPWLTVPDARIALAVLARAHYQAPDERLRTIGITGTNGKTTTAILLAAACEAAGLPAGVVGTLGRRSHAGAAGADEFLPGSHTTPEAPELYAALDEMCASGLAAAVLEVSSHALALERVHGMQFDVAVFTNLTRDHLDYHENMENYFAPPHIPLPDPGGDLRPRHPGRHPPPLHGIEPCRTAPEAAHYNILAAIAAANALDLDLERAAAGIARIGRIPGRAESIEAGQDFLVLVDYAHTDDALVNILGVARELAAKRVIVVFGCGGDRDRTKRPLMGAAAARLADLAILTSDNPRTEDPLSIIDQVAAGFEDRSARAVRKIEPDRAAAIAMAIRAARAGDVVVIAGKGHEPEQILAHGRVPFDDREVARHALQARAGRDS